MVDWNAVGDGSVFDRHARAGAVRRTCWRDPDKIEAAYGQSIQYSMSALISFVQTFHDDNLVWSSLGDHQPAAVVSGPDASHDVPITIIAHDPEVMNRIDSWGWQPGCCRIRRPGLADGRVPRPLPDRVRRKPRSRSGVPRPPSSLGFARYVSTAAYRT